MSVGRTAARSQHATRGLRTTEKASIIPSENGPCGWLHGLRSHSLPLYNSTAESLKVSFSFLLPSLLFFLLLLLHRPPPSPSLALQVSRKEPPQCCWEGWSGFFSTPVDSAHVDNIHRMSVNSINQRHLMKAQLGTSQLYNRLSFLRTPASPPCTTMLRVLCVQLHFFPTIIVKKKKSSS